MLTNEEINSAISDMLYHLHRVGKALSELNDIESNELDEISEALDVLEIKLYLMLEQ